MSKKMVSEVVQLAPDAYRPFYHNHRQVLIDDLKGLAEEMYRICQQHGIPCVMAVEAALDATGESMYSMKHFPKERLDKIGLTPRHLLACYALCADPEDVQAAVTLLMREGVIT